MNIGGKSVRRPLSSRDLGPGERLLVAAMESLGFGRFERVMIRNGEPVLTPWPRTVQGIRLAADPADNVRTGAKEVTLKHQVAELIEYIRGVEAGDILVLEFRHGLPFAMEIEVRGGTGRSDVVESADIQRPEL